MFRRRMLSAALAGKASTGTLTSPKLKAPDQNAWNGSFFASAGFGFACLRFLATATRLTPFFTLACVRKLVSSWIAKHRPVILVIGVDAFVAVSLFLPVRLASISS